MKKSGRNLLFALALTGSLTTLSADFLRVEGGLGSWSASPSGTFAYESDDSLDVEDELGVGSSSNFYFWVNFKHFFPLLPNLRLEYAAYDGDGDGRVPLSTPFGHLTLSGPVTSAFRMDQREAILYYNLLDETFWTTVDAGVDIKNVTGELMVEHLLSTESADLDFTLPLLYLRGRVAIPSTDLALEADLKALTYQGSGMTDARVKLEWTVASYAVDLGLELGLRSMKIKINDDLIDNTEADVTIQGLFYGVNARF